MKSVLTLRTGNAWVHVWAYHAFAPHVTLDTVTPLDDLHLRRPPAHGADAARTGSISAYQSAQLWA